MTTRVRDIMRTEVVTVTPDTSMLALARVLSDHGVSGVPVVADGRLVGVVSSTDVVRAAAEEGDVPAGRTRWVALPSLAEAEPEDEDWDPHAAYFLPEDGPRLARVWDGDAFGGGLADVLVADVMTPVTFSVSPDASVEELAGFLLRGRIHRAVVERDGRLLGIVTTFDLLRVLATEGEPLGAPAATDG